MTKLYVTTRTIQPTFIAKVQDGLFRFAGFIIIPVSVVVLVLFMLYAIFKQVFDYMLGKNVEEDETEIATALWTTLYQSEIITIERMEIYAEEAFDNINWEDFTLMKQPDDCTARRPVFS